MSYMVPARSPNYYVHLLQTVFCYCNLRLWQCQHKSGRTSGAMRGNQKGLSSLLHAWYKTNPCHEVPLLVLWSLDLDWMWNMVQQLIQVRLLIVEPNILGQSHLKIVLEANSEPLNVKEHSRRHPPHPQDVPPITCSILHCFNSLDMGQCRNINVLHCFSSLDMGQCRNINVLHCSAVWTWDSVET